MDKPLDVEVLLAWGRDWQRHLEAGPGCGFHMSALVLLQYVTTANEGLELLKQREARVIKRSGGRPRGTGMGGQAAALIASGVREEDAMRMIAARQQKPVDKVRDALRRHRAAQS
jgi:hypothetical protein